MMVIRIERIAGIYGFYSVLICLFFSGCGLGFKTPFEKAKVMMLSHKFQAVSFKTEPFELKGFMKTNLSCQHPLVVYIEGDGFSWIDRHTVSTDPTPKNPIALHLAARDPSANVLYLARPCQYTGGSAPGCSPRYWTTLRYSEVVVNAINEAINLAKQKVCSKSLGLVGFSGGGVVAALIAARRNDVIWLATIAANLDLDVWTAFHEITPFQGSLNPIDYALRLQAIPQIHFVGGKDDIVPESVVRSYQKRMTDPSLTAIKLIPEFNHHCCWVDSWTMLQKYLPTP